MANPLKYMLFIGAEGLNRTADTGIFSPKMTKFIKPLISTNYLDFKDFFIALYLGKY
jgi:hypothetical protein